MKRVHKPARITIRGPQVGRTLAAAIEDPQLMFYEQRLGNDGTEASWPF